MTVAIVMTSSSSDTSLFVSHFAPHVIDLDQAGGKTDATS
jgi:hypothetical protein